MAAVNAASRALLGFLMLAAKTENVAEAQQNTLLAQTAVQMTHCADHVYKSIIMVSIRRAVGISAYAKTKIARMASFVSG